MIGKRVILIITCGLMIFGTISFYYFNSIHPNNGSNNKKEINLPADLITAGGDDEIKNITLNTKTSNDIYKMNIYTLKTPIVNESNCKSIINEIYPMWFDENITEETFEDMSIGFYKNNGTISTENIVFTPGGQMEYTNHSAKKEWNGYLKAINISNETETGTNSSKGNVELITQEKAYQLTLEYIKKHGYLPNESFLFINHTSKHTTSNGTIINSSYTFSFNRKIDGYLIAGISGEGVRITITPLGDVYSYTVLWREIDSIKENIMTKSSSNALICLDQYVTMNVTIERIELGYLSEDSHKEQKELAPVWFFYTGSENPIYFAVDAVGLKYVE